MARSVRAAGTMLYFDSHNLTRSLVHIIVKAKLYEMRFGCDRMAMKGMCVHTGKKRRAISNQQQDKMATQSSSSLDA